MTTANTTTAICYEWIKIIPIFCQIDKIYIFFGVPPNFSNRFMCDIGWNKLKIAGLEHWLSTRVISPSQATWAISGDIFVGHSWGRGCCWNLIGAHEGCCYHAQHSPSPQKKILAQNVNSKNLRNPAWPESTYSFKVVKCYVLIPLFFFYLFISWTTYMKKNILVNFWAFLR